MLALCTEFTGKYGVIRDLLRLFEGIQRATPDLREILGLIQSIETKLNRAYPRYVLPSIIIKYLETADKALNELGFIAVFEEYRFRLNDD